MHRVGRTARAKATGVALTLVNENDMYKLKRIEDFIETPIMKIPLPPALGEGPSWNPVYISLSDKNFKGKFRKRSGKKKPYNIKRDKRT